MADSLDIARTLSYNTNKPNTFQAYQSNPNLQNPEHYASRQEYIHPPLSLDQQYYQQQHQFQPVSSPFRQQQQQQQLTGLFTLSHNGSLNEPLVQRQTALQFYPPPNSQFIPIQQHTPQPYQQQQRQYLQTQALVQQNMFYQEPLQPVFYNTNYYNQSNDYSNDPYQYQDYTQSSQLNVKRTAPQTNSGSKFAAQPLQHPHIEHAAKPLKQNNFNNQLNDDSPDSYDDNENAELENDFNAGKLNMNANVLTEDDLKRQQVWNKLQKANKEIKDKHRSSSKVKSGLPPVNNNVYSNNTIINSNSSNAKAAQMKKQLSISKEKKKELNHLDRNVEAIKNKENLNHRYPEKKYEIVYGKNLGERIKTIQQ